MLRLYYRIAHISLFKHPDVIEVQFEPTSEPDFINIYEYDLERDEIYSPK